MLDKFEQQVDPDGKLSPAERAKRAEFARKAHFKRLALKSAQARRRRGGDADGMKPNGVTTPPMKNRTEQAVRAVGGDHVAT